MKCLELIDSSLEVLKKNLSTANLLNKSLIKV